MSRKKQERINQALRLLSPSYKLVKNAIIPHTGNTLEHELCKYLLALEFIKEGKEIYTEVRFKDGKGRGDIFIPELFLVVEILHTETVEEVLTKKEYYPKELNIVYKTTEEILDGFGIRLS